MKKIFGVILLFLTGCFLFLPQVIAEGVSQGLMICATAILPALFPFFILTDLWIQLGYTAKLSQLAAPITETVFHLPGSAASAILLGSIGGYPMGARTAAQLYKDGQLTKHDAEQALYFCSNAGPAFVFGVMGAGVFQSTLAGAILYIIHIASAFAVGFILKPKRKPNIKFEKRTENHLPTSKAIVNSISQAGMTTIQVCIFVIFFSILTQCFLYLMPKNDLTAFLLGLLELASGARQLASLSWPASVKFTAAAFLLGTGGLCVMMQTQSILQEAGLSCKTAYIGKLLQAGISAIIAFFMTPVLPITSPCMAAAQSPWLTLCQQTTIILLVALITGMFLKKTSGNAGVHRI